MYNLDSDLICTFQKLVSVGAEEGIGVNGLDVWSPLKQLGNDDPCLYVFRVNRESANSVEIGKGVHPVEEGIGIAIDGEMIESIGHDDVFAAECMDSRLVEKFLQLATYAQVEANVQ